MRFTTVHSEGTLLSDDLLGKLAAGELPGQKPGDFGLDGKTRLSDEIASCWSDAVAYWEAFKHGLGTLSGLFMTPNGNIPL